MTAQQDHFLFKTMHCSVIVIALLFTVFICFWEGFQYGKEQANVNRTNSTRYLSVSADITTSLSLTDLKTGCQYMLTRGQIIVLENTACAGPVR